MGLQNRSNTNGASLLVIDQACDNDQLLVSLSKNGAQWLSPVGWTEQQKVTLLDCRLSGKSTEIDIPAEFAGDIKTGDVLVLRCSELDLEKEIIWEASEVETRSLEEAAPVATSLASGLLSRFKGNKSEPVEETKSEAELRAEEADRAAQSFKVKMEAATAAKEEAQRKALEAAREAEAALKMEADRIAEMERAAKAFEEAERLKQDELRRVDEERRAEEARLAEEARRIEEARKREIAAQKDTERKVALEGYETELNIIRGEELRLKSRLEDLQSKAQSEATNRAVQVEDLQSRQGLFVNTEETASKRFNSYENSASELDTINADMAILQTESETLAADRQSLSIRLSQADADYQAAQSEAEAAISRAEARRAELDIIRKEERDASEKTSAVSEKLLAQSQLVSDASEKTQQLQVKYENSQAELTQAKVEIEALEQALAVQGEEDQNLRLEIEVTQQAVEDSQAREAAHRDAIEHLQAGGSPEEISGVDFEPRNYEPSTLNFETDEADIATLSAESAGLKDSMMGRVRRSFAREKDAEISIDVEDVVMDTAEMKSDPVLLAGLDDTPSFVRRHGSSLMALGAIIGGIAILGGGLALNKSAKPKLEVKSSTPAPTQVVSAVETVELPKVSELTEAKKVEIKAVELPKIVTVEIKPAKMEEGLSKAEPITEEAVLDAEIQEDTSIVKLTEVVDPTGFAFELPDMMPTVQAKKSQTKVAAKKAKVEKPAVKKIPDTPKVETAVNYPELTSDVQTRLVKLGFYAGEIDGLQGQGTKAAITNFKTLFSLPVDDKITGALLTELKRAEREQDAAELLQTTHAEAEAEIKTQEAIQLAEATPSVKLYDTVQAVPSTPVVTDTLPATREYTPAAEPTQSYVAPEPEPEPVKVASIPAIVEPAPTPVAADVIVEEKLLERVSANYPLSAARRNYFVNTVIVVEYDIDTSGRVTNLSIASNDHSGRFNEAFEREAKRAVKKQRYKPRTVNGVAVETTGKQKRIVFRAK